MLRLHLGILMLYALIGTAFGTTYGPTFQAAADEFSVPEPLLVALAFEASRFDAEQASAWGGYGLYDLREDDESWGPGIEQVSILLDVSPDEVMRSPELQIRGAAALLAYHGERSGDALPPVDELEAWAPAIRAFSARQEPHLQDLFTTYVFEVVEQGVYTDHARVLPAHVDFAEVGNATPPNYDGAYQFVSASSSNYSNYSRSNSDISYIIIHTVQGSYSGCISWFQNSSASVSAHYVVRSSDGQVTQMVYEEDVAWHAGNWSYNEASVGIEHEGYVDAPDTWYTDAMYEESAKLSADVIERTATSADRSHVIAHYEVPGATHTDPGTGWDWDLYMDLIDGGSVSTPSAEMLGVIAAEDIYTGERLSAVTVTLDQTGEKDTTDGDGYYRFGDLSAGTWSVTVNVDGYETGGCETDITSNSGQWWCSIALQPGEPDTDPPDDTDEPVDTGEPNTDRPVRVPPPGSKEPIHRGCTSAPGVGGLAALAALGLLLVRRRR
ncbi:MAG: hypothetical protein GY913_34045 [Proteobacteria bacterium]|nr:hypothetical protein [Pseudomonadota bacterium]MCP4921951.1 hypothetical protein [Pseudomonadota bacterium]